MTAEPKTSPKSIFAGLGKNFLTPDVLAYQWKEISGKWWAVELSEGRDFEHRPIFGVTFRDPENPDEAEVELSGMFRSKREALDYLDDPEKGKS